jgi:Tfp pilus assembly protein PilX
MTIQLKQKKEKGLALIFSLFVVILLSASIGILYMSSVNEARQVQNSNAGLQALSEAEAGIAYASAIEQQNNFLWYTHSAKNTASLSCPHTPCSPENYVSGAALTNGCLTVSGKSFKVKAYPEKRSGQLTGTVIVLSQATVNNTTRTIEKRLAQSSAYQYFFFFPKSHTFETATYDGRNAGSIHVNGDISLTGELTFKFLKELSCGPELEGSAKGYFYRPVNLKYGSGSGAYSFYDISSGGSNPNPNYDNTAAAPRGVSANLPYMYNNTNYHFDTGTTTFAYGTYTTTVPPPDAKILPCYLPGTSWQFPKYSPTAASGSHYNIGSYNSSSSNQNYSNLTNAALYQQTYQQTNPTIAAQYNLFLLNTGVEPTMTGNFDVQANPNPNPNIEALNKYIQGVPPPSHPKEKEIFDYIANPTYNLSTNSVLWNEFWDRWKYNHRNEYSAYHNNSPPTLI